MAEIKNTDNNKYWQEYGKIGTLIYCRYKYKMVQCFWKTVWHFLEMVKSGATYDLAIMLLIIYAQKKWKHMSTQELVCKYSEQHHSDSQKAEKTQVSISGWWVNKMCSIHTTEYYSAMKRSEVFTSATERMILESITLSARSQMQRPMNDMVLLIWNIQSRQI